MIIQSPDGRRPSTPISPPHWYQRVLQVVARAIATYQAWNAVYLDPRQYAQAPHCYTTMQHAIRHTERRQQRHTIGDDGRLDTFVAILRAKSNTDLAALIARLDADNGPAWAAAIGAMSAADVAYCIAMIEAEARVSD